MWRKHMRRRRRRLTGLWRLLLPLFGHNRTLNNYVYNGQFPCPWFSFIAFAKYQTEWCHSGLCSVSSQLVQLYENKWAPLWQFWLQGIVGQHYLLCHHKGWSSISYPKRIIKEALKLISLAFREFSSYHFGYLDTSWAVPTFFFFLHFLVL